MFRYVIFHVGATLSSLNLRHSSFSNPSVVSLTSKLILQLFRTSQALHLHNWRAYHDIQWFIGYIDFILCVSLPQTGRAMGRMTEVQFLLI